MNPPISSLLFSCPVCGAPLTDDAARLFCPQGHSFDWSKYHYVNLALSNASGGKRHGDDRAMVLARQAFLDAGHYAPLRDAVCALLKERLIGAARILDVGCGEGSYTAAMRTACPDAAVAGVDLSRDALRQAAKRDRRLQLAVASAARLPAADASFDTVTCLFAPMEAAEYARVLRPGGLLVWAVVLEEHLMGLKAAVYDRPVPNPPPVERLPGFRLTARQDIRYELHLTESAQIQALFQMTPYYYKTSRADQEKLLRLEALDTSVAFGLMVYEKA